MSKTFKFEDLEIKIEQELEKSDLIPGRGTIQKPRIFEAVNDSKLPNCFDNNQNAMYLTAVYPGFPGSKVRDAQIDEVKFADDKPSTFFRMRKDEAFLLVGHTPPQCRYFSFTPYIYERYFEQDLRYYQVYNSLNDPINNLTINPHKDKEKSPFCSPTAIIFAADNTTAATVKQCLIDVHIPENVINLSVIPSCVVNLGLKFGKDVLMTLFRFYGPEDDKKMEDYLKELPMAAYRITPKLRKAEFDPLPMPKLRVRGTGETEMGLLPKLEKLRKAILEKYENEGWQPSEYTTDQWLQEGLQALQANKNMFGENRDVAYMCTDSFTMYDNEFIVIYGVDHTRTRKAAYCSAAVYGQVYYNGVIGSNSMKDNWKKSANQFLPDDPESDSFFVLSASRSKGIPEAGPDLEVPTDIKTEGIHKYAPLFVGFRSYLEETTASGPIPEEMVSPRVIKFSKSANAFKKR